jgi:hypothetical protein
MVAGAGRVSRRQDLYLLGVCMLSASAADGWVGQRDALPLIPSDLSPPFTDFLTALLGRGEYESIMPSAEQLLAHRFLVEPLPVPTKTPLSFLEHVDNVRTSTDQAEFDLEPMPSTSGSRLLSEFKCIETIGKGGFGDVIKVCRGPCVQMTFVCAGTKYTRRPCVRAQAYSVVGVVGAQSTFTETNHARSETVVTSEP